MTTKADERIARIEEAITRLEALGLTGPSPSPSAINPDGSPGHVVSGQLIESAWGNSVSDEFQRQRGWLAQSATAFTVPGAMTDVPGLVLTVPFRNGALYNITAFIPHLVKSLPGNLLLQITNQSNVAMVESVTTAGSNEPRFMFASVFAASLGGNLQVKVRMSSTAGDSSIQGGTGKTGYIMVQEISKTFA